MSKKLTLPQTFKRIFYTCFFVLWVSGIGCLLIGENEHFITLRQWFIKSHGGFAMIALLLLGYLIPTHIQTGIARKINEKTGWILIATCITLIISGYGLYYFSHDTLRQWNQWIHNLSGGFFPLILIWHIYTGRKKKRRLSR